MTLSIPTTPEQPPELARVYTFAELMSLVPGTMIGGLVHSQGEWMLGTSWGLMESDVHPRRKHILVKQPFSEYRLTWRQRLRHYCKTVKNAKLYNPPYEIIRDAAANPCMTVKIGFDTNMPVGMYLGHIVRTSGLTLVNILVPDGYDVWL
ncbi:MAG: hypothetical protein E6R04_01755 [Spirochaetes bacterium]|nr:MAG: hypothetical protein E6R04_01755 [Spirochaetota bacterium]